MEPRGAICEYDSKDDRSTLWVSSQGVGMLRPVVADMILKIGSPKLRVRTGDVGGGFGMKIFVHPEYPMVVWASRELKRTVKWIPDRQEAFQSDVQGRDHVSIAEMALDKDSRFIGFKVTTYAALGAYLNHFSVFIPTLAGSSMLNGLYATPAIYVNVKGVMTNTVPTDAYRGAGRPEASYLMERFVDHIAREVGLTPDELRKRNFIKPGQLPYKTALGDTYDSGDFETVMRKGMEKADWKGFPARRAQSLAKGKWRGIGMATYVEKCSGGNPETVKAVFNDNGTITLFTGNQTNGQGHETALSQIASGKLGIDIERIKIVQGDSDVVPDGFTGGSRTIAINGAATVGVADKIIAKGKPLAANMLEASAGDIDYKDGEFRIVGTDRKVSLFDVAQANKGALDDDFTRTPEADTFPNGCHICELEVDPDTGTVEILNYTVMDDFGKALNPLLLQGQIHGGIGQGAAEVVRLDLQPLGNILHRGVRERGRAVAEPGRSGEPLKAREGEECRRVEPGEPVEGIRRSPLEGEGKPGSGVAGDATGSRRKNAPSEDRRLEEGQPEDRQPPPSREGIEAQGPHGFRTGAGRGSGRVANHVFWIPASRAIRQSSTSFSYRTSASGWSTRVRGPPDCATVRSRVLSSFSGVTWLS